MKKIGLILFISAACFRGYSQQKEGKVIYERTLQVQITINDAGQQGQNISRTNTDRFELLFGNNQSLWYISDEGTPPDEGPGGGMQIRMIGGGADDISFYDFTKGVSTEQREMFNKKFIISDSIKKMNWKLTGETKTILNHVCQQATAQRTGTRMTMNMNNGNMERKEVGDTTSIVAWFTPDIPVAAGPAEYQGQLPGLVLEVDLNNGKQTFKATEILAKTNITAIKEPKNGKKVTRDEMKKETQKMMADMEKNNAGGNRSIRFNN